MTERALGSANEQDIDAEICVAGGGMAGLVLASQLGETRRVVVLESGPATGDPLDELNEVEDIGARYRTARTGRVRVLGGSSTVWGGRLLPITPADMAARPHLDAAAWPIAWEELDRHTAAVESVMGVASGPFDGGLSEPLPTMVGLVERRPKWGALDRINLARQVGPAFRRDGGPLIITNATVVGFELDRETGRVAAIEARSLVGGRVRVRARRFILAAGAIESTRLLLLLDGTCEGRVSAGTSALGRYFQDHVALSAGEVKAADLAATTMTWGYRFTDGTRRSVHLEIAPDTQVARGSANAFVQVPIELPAKSPLADVKTLVRSLQSGRLGQSWRAGARVAANLPFLARLGYWRMARHRLLLPPTARLLLSLVVEQAPVAINRVSLSDQRDRFGLRKARIDWRVSSNDARTARTTAELVRSGWAASSLATSCPIDWREGVFDSSLEELAGRMGSVFHPSGSARMGLDASSSVVDQDLRCHAVPNLYVASSATFPSAGAANPSMTLLQLVFRLAEHLKRSA